MPAKINLKNQQFGNILVLEETPERKNKSIVWKCKCLLCEEYCYFSTKQLRNDGIQQCTNCGHHCIPQTNLRENIIGKTFNNLTVDFKTNQHSGGKILYSCTCNCGKTNILVSSTDLKNGHTKSCGCENFKYKNGDIINNRLILNIHPLLEKTSNKHRAHYYYCKCLLCNREYIATSDSLTRAQSCGCLKSKGELEIIRLLNENSINYIYQYQIPDLNKQTFDFAILDKNKKIFYFIEFDGEQHYEINIKSTGWNDYTHYLKVKEHDLQKDNYAKNKNIPLIRIPYWERGKLTLESIFNLSLLDLKKVMEGE